MTADDITALLSQLSLPSTPPSTPTPAPIPSSLTVSLSPSKTTYVVFVGHRPGVYNSWSECLAQTKGAPHNSYKGYASFAAAERAYSAAKARGLVCTAEMRAANVRRVIRRQLLTLEDLPLCTHFLEDATSKAMASDMSRYYVVYAGIQPGVYLTFHECSFLTSGYKGSVHRSFDTREAATQSLERAFAERKVVKFVLQ
ncbi:hypothetical protein BD626DRAFT_575731 [Schizophyllum amplum]|uniref:Ribonuclease H1 N-terminal domain-containing protein n=1 Tax=Schizophyllum amplum TaxID=97359 RepID=A0A550BV28_9AGAR|nr:hypothetical protein BD626DRAFT_575731 [Auriculariopsis ampla]